MVMDEKFHEKALNLKNLIPAAPNIQHVDVRALSALHNLSKWTSGQPWDFFYAMAKRLSKVRGVPGKENVWLWGFPKFHLWLYM